MWDLTRYIIQRNSAHLIAGVLLVFLAVGITGSVWAKPITDTRGRRIDVSKPYKKIISLYGAHTENLFFLNSDTQIIGVSVNDKYPAKAKNKPKFSYHDGPEKFLAASPDLVLIRPMIDNGYPKLIRRLEKSGITVASFQPGTVEQMYEYWHNLGKLTGRTEQSDQMVRDFREKIARIERMTAGIRLKKKVYFEAIHTRMKTFSDGAMPIFALETAGGVNVAADAVPSRNTNIANYGKERILAKAGLIDVFLAQKGVMNAVTIEMIKQEPGFRVIKAVKTNQVFLIDENIVSRPVPRLYNGVVTIGRYLYPDLFHGEQFEY